MSAPPTIRSLAPLPPRLPGGPRRNGHGPEPRPSEDLARPSAYLALLPDIYSEDDFTGRFLRIFEHVLQPISDMVDNQPYYFDSATSPEALLDWLAMWVALAEGEDWPVPRRRALIAAAVMLYQLRGTRTGIKQHVSIFAGSVTLVMERTDGFRLDSEARLGINTMVGRDLPHTFTVTIAAYDPDSIDLDTVRAILEGDKPIETSYRLRVVPFTGDAHAAGAEERSQY